MVKHAKAKSFYDVFERKGPGQKVTHYCPGCGHGTVHKLVADSLDELELQDRTIFCSPVGCSVFAYYYFDTGNIQCAHGRAPAVATAIRRTHKDSIVISYQGDGDLAGIGTAEIIHAANRGENITVIFINNAIYGMTGGQMAPTTLVGQKTQTTPAGRTISNDGAPIGMAEIISAIKTPVYIERTSLSTPAGVMKTRKAVKKALRYQAEGKGFSFVEVLSPCPVNWKMSSAQARKWIKENLELVFPVNLFRDEGEKAQAGEAVPGDGHFMTPEQMLDHFGNTEETVVEKRKEPLKQTGIRIAGFGGQGVMSASTLLAECVIAEGRNATWLPSYGPEMRGGTANASVIASEDIIGSPLVDRPDVLIALNIPSLDAFEQSVNPGGVILYNSSIIEREVTRTDISVLPVPASDLAKEAGLLAAANIILLTIYAAYSGLVSVDTIKAVLPASLKKKQYLDVNLKLIDTGLAYYEEHLEKSV